MEITHISRTYSRSVQVKKPDGTEVWIKHEATIEANTDGQMINTDLAALAQLVVSEVASSIKEEKAKILASFGVSDEPFKGKSATLASQPRL